MRIREQDEWEFVFGDCSWCWQPIVQPLDRRAAWTHYRGVIFKTQQKCALVPGNMARPSAYTMNKWYRIIGRLGRPLGGVA